VALDWRAAAVNSIADAEVASISDLLAFAGDHPAERRSGRKGSNPETVWHVLQTFWHVLRSEPTP
jgi:hypothetical protein